MPRSFENRFADKLAKVDPAEVEAFLQRLIKQRDFLEVVFDSLHEGVIVASPALKVLTCNRRAAEMLGIAEKRRLGGRPLLDVLTIPELRRAVLSLEPDLSKPRRDEVVVRGRDEGHETQRHLVVQTLPLHSQEREVRGLLIILQDFTEQLALEQQKREVEKMGSLARLTAGVAHEIKNPLNSLSIHAQILRKQAEKAERQDGFLPASAVSDSLSVILEETKRLENVVNDFLQAVRPTTPSLEPRDINAVCRHVAELMRPVCDQAEVRLGLRLDPDADHAQFDERQVTQAVLNLTKNSLEAIEEKREHPDRYILAEESAEVPEDSLPEGDHILLRTRGGDRTISVVVADTGCGISEENMKRVFEPYFTTKFHGTGLGLMNVFRIVQEHDGRLDLKSEVGRGTIVTVTLPRRAARPIKYLTQTTSEESEPGDRGDDEAAPEVLTKSSDSERT